jgi:type VI secretion system protein ImpH
MASSGWRTNSTLSELVFEQYGRFNVYQLMRLLRWKPRGKGERERQQVQLEAWNVEQRFRFRADLSAAFPGREISGLKIAPSKSQPRSPMARATSFRHPALAPEIIEIKTPDYCVASAIGPLPEPFTEWVRDQEKSREHAMSAFLDMFNQRLNVLRFQMKANQTLGLNNLPPEDTQHAHYLASLMGMDQSEQSDQSAQVPLPRRGWLAAAGLLANCRKSAPAVTQILSLFVGAKASMTELVGAWQRIEGDDRIALGRANHALGQRSVLGQRIWDQQARVHIEIAPLDYAHFCTFLPPGIGKFAGASALPSHYHGFVALLRLLLDRLCDVEVRLQVRAETIPAGALQDAPIAGSRNLRLGQTAWLGSANNSGIRSVTYLVPAYDPMQETA